MYNFKQIADEFKGYVASAKTAFDGITSPITKVIVASFAAMLLLMIVWAVLPWIGFIFAAIVVAFLAKAFWPTDGGN